MVFSLAPPSVLRGIETGVVASRPNQGLEQYPKSSKAGGKRGESIRLRYTRSCDLGKQGALARLPPNSKLCLATPRHLLLQSYLKGKKVSSRAVHPVVLLCGVSVFAVVDEIK